jgi:putative DNA primase/helicase
MTAAELADALGGRRVGGGWMACCPAHKDRTPSLSVRESRNGKVLVRCYAGCDQLDVVAALQARGLWADIHRRTIISRERRTPIERKPDPDDAKRTQTALAIWESAVPASGTPVETYFASRGIFLPIPDTLRFHAGLRHPSGGIWPAMVALVTNGADGTPLAVHRTFLVRDGKGKAPLDPQKMMLGPCRGGAVQFASPRLGEWFAVAEGIETTAAVVVASKIPAWAALSAGGIRALKLPPEATHVVICADHDASGTGERAARDAAARWLTEGRRVRIAMPVDAGSDMADVLVGTTMATEARHVA